ncbi:hypothetical protein VTN96DRAFT_4412 [Rasamsonia emersonii]
MALQSLSSVTAVEVQSFVFMLGTGQPQGSMMDHGSHLDQFRSALSRSLLQKTENVGEMLRMGSSLHISSAHPWGRGRRDCPVWRAAPVRVSAPRPILLHRAPALIDRDRVIGG